jgi:penicillin-binding protein 2
MPPPVQARPLREERFRLLAALAGVGFALVVLGLLRLQVVEHGKYGELSKENRVRLEVLRAPRGAIYDRHGELLADSAPAFTILFRPFPAESAHRIAETRSSAWVARVATLVGLDTTLVRRRISEANATGQSGVLRRNAPFEILAAVEEVRGELPGLEVQVEPIRRYPNGVLGAHLLGYAGEINDKELETRKALGYRSGDLIGRSGVERAYEEILRGADGAEFVVVNAMGRRVSTLTEGPPQPPVGGHDLTLTLDLRLQRALEESMEGVERGAAVVLDPRDGGILALLSRPTFDPNEFSSGLSRARWAELSSGGSNPLLDRAIQGTYPPGSTFKIVTMLSALRNGVARPDTKLAPCGGHYVYGGRSFGCWKPSGHGSLDFIGALQHSCDVYFYQIGIKLGLDNLQRTARDLGLGAKTGVDLPQERGGLIPDQAWYDKAWGKGKWRKGVMLNLAIGQGELLLTPLQLALMTAEVANGGKPLRPHIVDRVAGARDFRLERPQHAGVEAPPEVWAAVHEALERVVASGTGTAARLPGVRVGGKTGTAQNPHGKDHALFVCYAPIDDPRIVIAMVVENSGHGGSVAAPRAGRVLARALLPDSVADAMLRPRVAALVRPAPDTTGVTVGD